MHNDCHVHARGDEKASDILRAMDEGEVESNRPGCATEEGRAVNFSSATQDKRMRLWLVLLFLPILSSCTRRRAKPRGEPSAPGKSSPTAGAVARAKELVESEKALISRLEGEEEDASASELLKNLRGGAERDAAKASMLDRLVKRKRLVWKSSPASIGGRTCRVLLFDTLTKSWPGAEPQTAVLTDEEYDLLAWKELGGSPVYQSARLEKRGGSTVLAVTCSHRRGPRGTYRYSLSLGGISRIGDIEWDEGDEAPGPFEGFGD